MGGVGAASATPAGGVRGSVARGATVAAWWSGVAGVSWVVVATV